MPLPLVFVVSAVTTASIVLKTISDLENNSKNQDSDRLTTYRLAMG